MTEFEGFDVYLLPVISRVVLNQSINVVLFSSLEAVNPMIEGDID